MGQIAKFFGLEDPDKVTPGVDQNSFYGTTIDKGITGMSFEDYEVKTKIDTSYLAIADNKKKAEANNKKKAEEQFNISLNAVKAQKQALLDKGNLSPEEIQNLQELDAKSKSKFSDLSAEKVEFFANQNNTPAETAKVAPTAPTTVIAGGTPNPNPVSGGSNGPAVAPIMDKNPANIYDKGRSQVYDASQIPAVLKGGKIQPARYFAMNGLNWYKDAKRIAAEAGIENYNGMPGQNYAMVNYLEGKKNGNSNSEGSGPSRKFDSIATDDTIPNRFTQEDRDTLLTMQPDEQKRYIQKRNLDDLQKMLPGNVGLINKVFGTNYTSDDLTGGISRTTIAGTGMTQAGMEVQKLIAGLKPGQADKFMNKGMELDNSQADNVVIDGGNQTVQMGRRKLLEGMVNNGQNTLPGTSLDATDLAYVEQYKDYKAQTLVADKYNNLVGQYNAMDPKNVLRNKVLDSIHQYVDTIKATSPSVYQSLAADLDKFPQFANTGSKIPMISDKKMPGDSPIEKGTKTVPGNSPSKTGLEIAPPSNNTITPGTKTNPDGSPIVTVPTNDTEGDHVAKIVDSTPKPLAKSSGGGYSNYNDADARIGFSSNSISKG